MCACPDVRKTRAWEHPGRASGVAGGGVGRRVLALRREAGVTRLPSSCSLFPLKPVLRPRLHAREARTCDLYAKKVQNN